MFRSQRSCTRNLRHTAADGTTRLDWEDSTRPSVMPASAGTLDHSRRHHHEASQSDDDRPWPPSKQALLGCTTSHPRAIVQKKSTPKRPSRHRQRTSSSLASSKNGHSESTKLDLPSYRRANHVDDAVPPPLVTASAKFKRKGLLAIVRKATSRVRGKRQVLQQQRVEHLLPAQPTKPNPPFSTESNITTTISPMPSRNNYLADMTTPDPILEYDYDMESPSTKPLLATAILTPETVPSSQLSFASSEDGDYEEDGDDDDSSSILSNYIQHASMHGSLKAIRHSGNDNNNQEAYHNSGVCSVASREHAEEPNHDHVGTMDESPLGKKALFINVETWQQSTEAAVPVDRLASTEAEDSHEPAGNDDHGSHLKAPGKIDLVHPLPGPIFREPGSCGTFDLDTTTCSSVTADPKIVVTADPKIVTAAGRGSAAAKPAVTSDSPFNSPPRNHTTAASRFMYERSCGPVDLGITQSPFSSPAKSSHSGSGGDVTVSAQLLGIQDAHTNSTTSLTERGSSREEVSRAMDMDATLSTNNTKDSCRLAVDLNNVSFPSTITTTSSHQRGAGAELDVSFPLSRELSFASIDQPKTANLLPALKADHDDDDDDDDDQDFPGEASDQQQPQFPTRETSPVNHSWDSNTTSSKGQLSSEELPMDFESASCGCSDASFHSGAIPFDETGSLLQFETRNSAQVQSDVPAKRVDHSVEAGASTEGIESQVGDDNDNSSGTDYAVPSTSDDFLLEICAGEVLGGDNDTDILDSNDVSMSPRPSLAESGMPDEAGLGEANVDRSARETLPNQMSSYSPLPSNRARRRIRRRRILREEERKILKQTAVQTVLLPRALSTNDVVRISDFATDSVFCLASELLAENANSTMLVENKGGLSVLADSADTTQRSATSCGPAHQSRQVDEWVRVYIGDDEAVAMPRVFDGMDYDRNNLHEPIPSAEDQHANVEGHLPGHNDAAIRALGMNIGRVSGLFFSEDDAMIFGPDMQLEALVDNATESCSAQVTRFGGGINSCEDQAVSTESQDGSVVQILSSDAAIEKGSTTWDDLNNLDVKSTIGGDHRNSGDQNSTDSMLSQAKGEHTVSAVSAVPPNNADECDRVISGVREPANSSDSPTSPTTPPMLCKHPANDCFTHALDQQIFEDFNILGEEKISDRKLFQKDQVVGIDTMESDSKLNLPCKESASAQHNKELQDAPQDHVINTDNERLCFSRNVDDNFGPQLWSREMHEAEESAFHSSVTGETLGKDIRFVGLETSEVDVVEQEHPQDTRCSESISSGAGETRTNSNRDRTDASTTADRPRQSAEFASEEDHNVPDGSRFSESVVSTKSDNGRHRAFSKAPSYRTDVKPMKSQLSHLVNFLEKRGAERKISAILNPLALNDRDQSDTDSGCQSGLITDDQSMECQSEGVPNVVAELGDALRGLKDSDGDVLECHGRTTGPVVNDEPSVPQETEGQVEIDAQCLEEALASNDTENPVVQGLSDMGVTPAQSFTGWSHADVDAHEHYRNELPVEVNLEADTPESPQAAAKSNFEAILDNLSHAIFEHHPRQAHQIGSIVTVEFRDRRCYEISATPRAKASGQRQGQSRCGENSSLTADCESGGHFYITEDVTDESSTDLVSVNLSSCAGCASSLDDAQAAVDGDGDSTVDRLNQRRDNTVSNTDIPSEVELKGDPMNVYQEQLEFAYEVLDARDSKADLSIVSSCKSVSSVGFAEPCDEATRPSNHSVGEVRDPAESHSFPGLRAIRPREDFPGELGVSACVPDSSVSSVRMQALAATTRDVSLPPMARPRVDAARGSSKNDIETDPWNLSDSKESTVQEVEGTCEDLRMPPACYLSVEMEANHNYDLINTLFEKSVASLYPEINESLDLGKAGGSAGSTDDQDDDAATASECVGQLTRIGLDCDSTATSTHSNAKHSLRNESETKIKPKDGCMTNNDNEEYSSLTKKRSHPSRKRARSEGADILAFTMRSCADVYERSQNKAPRYTCFLNTVHRVTSIDFGNVKVGCSASKAPGPTSFPELEAQGTSDRVDPSFDKCTARALLARAESDGEDEPAAMSDVEPKPVTNLDREVEDIHLTTPRDAKPYVSPQRDCSAELTISKHEAELRDRVRTPDVVGPPNQEYEENTFSESGKSDSTSVGLGHGHGQQQAEVQLSMHTLDDTLSKQKSQPTMNACQLPTPTQDDEYSLLGVDPIVQECRAALQDLPASHPQVEILSTIDDVGDDMVPLSRFETHAMVAEFIESELMHPVVERLSNEKTIGHVDNDTYLGCDTVVSEALTTTICDDSLDLSYPLGLLRLELLSPPEIEESLQCYEPTQLIVETPHTEGNGGGEGSHGATIPQMVQKQTESVAGAYDLGTLTNSDHRQCWISSGAGSDRAELEIVGARFVDKKPSSQVEITICSPEHYKYRSSVHRDTSSASPGGHDATASERHDVDVVATKPNCDAENPPDASCGSDGSQVSWLAGKPADAGDSSLSVLSQATAATEAHIGISDSRSPGNEYDGGEEDQQISGIVTNVLPDSGHTLHQPSLVETSDLSPSLADCRTRCEDVGRSIQPAGVCEVAPPIGGFDCFQSTNRECLVSAESTTDRCEARGNDPGVGATPEEIHNCTTLEHLGGNPQQSLGPATSPALLAEIEHLDCCQLRMMHYSDNEASLATSMDTKEIAAELDLTAHVHLVEVHVRLEEGPQDEVVVHQGGAKDTNVDFNGPTDPAGFGTCAHQTDVLRALTPSLCTDAYDQFESSGSVGELENYLYEGDDDVSPRESCDSEDWVIEPAARTFEDECVSIAISCASSIDFLHEMDSTEMYHEENTIEEGIHEATNLETSVQYERSKSFDSASSIECGMSSVQHDTILDHNLKGVRTDTLCEADDLEGHTFHGYLHASAGSESITHNESCDHDRLCGIRNQNVVQAIKHLDLDAGSEEFNEVIVEEEQDPSRGVFVDAGSALLERPPNQPNEFDPPVTVEHMRGYVSPSCILLDNNSEAKLQLLKPIVDSEEADGLLILESDGTSEAATDPTTYEEQFPSPGETEETPCELYVDVPGEGEETGAGGTETEGIHGDIFKGAVCETSILNESVHTQTFVPLAVAKSRYLDAINKTKSRRGTDRRSPLQTEATKQNAKVDANEDNELIVDEAICCSLQSEMSGRAEPDRQDPCSQPPTSNSTEEIDGANPADNLIALDSAAQIEYGAYVRPIFDISDRSSLENSTGDECCNCDNIPGNDFSLEGDSGPDETDQSGSIYNRSEDSESPSCRTSHYEGGLTQDTNLAFPDASDSALSLVENHFEPPAIPGGNTFSFNLEDDSTQFEMTWSRVVAVPLKCHLVARAATCCLVVTAKEQHFSTDGDSDEQGLMDNSNVVGSPSTVLKLETEIENWMAKTSREPKIDLTENAENLYLVDSPANLHNGRHEKERIFMSAETTGSCPDDSGICDCDTTTDDTDEVRQGSSDNMTSPKQHPTVGLAEIGHSHTDANRPDTSEVITAFGHGPCVAAAQDESAVGEIENVVEGELDTYILVNALSHQSVQTGDNLMSELIDSPTSERAKQDTANAQNADAAGEAFSPYKVEADRDGIERENAALEVEGSLFQDVSLELDRFAASLGAEAEAEVGESRLDIHGDGDSDFDRQDLSDYDVKAIINAENDDVEADSDSQDCPAGVVPELISSEDHIGSTIESGAECEFSVEADADAMAGSDEGRYEDMERGDEAEQSSPTLIGTSHAAESEDGGNSPRKSDVAVNDQQPTVSEDISTSSAATDDVVSERVAGLRNIDTAASSGYEACTRTMEGEHEEPLAPGGAQCDFWNASVEAAPGDNATNDGDDSLTDTEETRAAVLSGEIHAEKSDTASLGVIRGECARKPIRPAAGTEAVATADGPTAAVLRTDFAEGTVSSHMSYVAAEMLETDLALTTDDEQPTNCANSSILNEQTYEGLPVPFPSHHIVFGTRDRKHANASSLTELADDVASDEVLKDIKASLVTPEVTTGRSTGAFDMWWSRVNDPPSEDITVRAENKECIDSSVNADIKVVAPDDAEKDVKYKVSRKGLIIMDYEVCWAGENVIASKKKAVEPEETVTVVSITSDLESHAGKAPTDNLTFVAETPRATYVASTDSIAGEVRPNDRSSGTGVRVPAFHEKGRSEKLENDDASTRGLSFLENNTGADVQETSGGNRALDIVELADVENDNTGSLKSKVVSLKENISESDTCETNAATELNPAADDEVAKVVTDSMPMDNAKPEISSTEFKMSWVRVATIPTKGRMHCNDDHIAYATTSGEAVEPVTDLSAITNETSAPIDASTTVFEMWWSRVILVGAKINKTAGDSTGAASGYCASYGEANRSSDNSVINEDAAVQLQPGVDVPMSSVQYSSTMPDLELVAPDVTGRVLPKFRATDADCVGVLCPNFEICWSRVTDLVADTTDLDCAEAAKGSLHSRAVNKEAALNEENEDVMSTPTNASELAAAADLTLVLWSEEKPVEHLPNAADGGAEKDLADILTMGKAATEESTDFEMSWSRIYAPLPKITGPANRKTAFVGVTNEWDAAGYGDSGIDTTPIEFGDSCRVTSREEIVGADHDYVVSVTPLPVVSGEPGNHDTTSGADDLSKLLVSRIASVDVRTEENKTTNSSSIKLLEPVPPGKAEKGRSKEKNTGCLPIYCEISWSRNAGTSSTEIVAGAQQTKPTTNVAGEKDPADTLPTDQDTTGASSADFEMWWSRATATSSKERFRTESKSAHTTNPNSNGSLIPSQLKVVEAHIGEIKDCTISNGSRLVVHGKVGKDADKLTTGEANAGGSAHQEFEMHWSRVKRSKENFAGKDHNLGVPAEVDQKFINSLTLAEDTDGGLSFGSTADSNVAVLGADANRANRLHRESTANGNPSKLFEMTWSRVRAASSKAKISGYESRQNDTTLKLNCPVAADKVSKDCLPGGQSAAVGMSIKFEKYWSRLHAVRSRVKIIQADKGVSTPTEANGTDRIKMDDIRLGRLSGPSKKIGGGARETVTATTRLAIAATSDSDDRRASVPSEESMVEAENPAFVTTTTDLNPAGTTEAAKDITDGQPIDKSTTLSANKVGKYRSRLDAVRSRLSAVRSSDRKDGADSTVPFSADKGNEASSLNVFSKKTTAVAAGEIATQMVLVGPGNAREAPLERVAPDQDTAGVLLREVITESEQIENTTAAADLDQASANEAEEEPTSTGGLSFPSRETGSDLGMVEVEVNIDASLDIAPAESPIESSITNTDATGSLPLAAEVIDATTMDSNAAQELLSTGVAEINVVKSPKALSQPSSVLKMKTAIENRILNPEGTPAESVPMKRGVPETRKRRSSWIVDQPYRTNHTSTAAADKVYEPTILCAKSGHEGIAPAPAAGVASTDEKTNDAHATVDFARDSADDKDQHSQYSTTPSALAADDVVSLETSSASEPEQEQHGSHGSASGVQPGSTCTEVGVDGHDQPLVVEATREPEACAVINKEIEPSSDHGFETVFCTTIRCEGGDYPAQEPVRQHAEEKAGDEEKVIMLNQVEREVGRKCEGEIRNGDHETWAFDGEGHGATSREFIFKDISEAGGNAHRKVAEDDIDRSPHILKTRFSEYHFPSFSDAEIEVELGSDVESDVEAFVGVETENGNERIAENDTPAALLQSARSNCVEEDAQGPAAAMDSCKRFEIGSFSVDNTAMTSEDVGWIGNGRCDLSDSTDLRVLEEAEVHVEDADAMSHAEVKADVEALPQSQACGPLDTVVEVKLNGETAATISSEASDMGDEVDDSEAGAAGAKANAESREAAPTNETWVATQDDARDVVIAKDGALSQIEPKDVNMSEFNECREPMEESAVGAETMHTESAIDGFVAGPASSEEGFGQASSAEGENILRMPPPGGQYDEAETVDAGAGLSVGFGEQANDNDDDDVDAFVLRALSEAEARAKQICEAKVRNATNENTTSITGTVFRDADNSFEDCVGVEAEACFSPNGQSAFVESLQPGIPTKFETAEELRCRASDKESSPYSHDDFATGTGPEKPSCTTPSDSNIIWNDSSSLAGTSDNIPPKERPKDETAPLVEQACQLNSSADSPLAKTSENDNKNCTEKEVLPQVGTKKHDSNETGAAGLKPGSPKNQIEGFRNRLSKRHLMRKQQLDCDAGLEAIKCTVRDPTGPSQTPSSPQNASRQQCRKKANDSPFPADADNHDPGIDLKAYSLHEQPEICPGNSEENILSADPQDDVGSDNAQTNIDGDKEHQGTTVKSIKFVDDTSCQSVASVGPGPLCETTTLCLPDMLSKRKPFQTMVGKWEILRRGKEESTMTGRNSQVQAITKVAWNGRALLNGHTGDALQLDPGHPTPGHFAKAIGDDPDEPKKVEMKGKMEEKTLVAGKKVSFQSQKPEKGPPHATSVVVQESGNIVSGTTARHNSSDKGTSTNLRSRLAKKPNVLAQLARKAAVVEQLGSIAYHRRASRVQFSVTQMVDLCERSLRSRNAMKTQDRRDARSLRDSRAENDETSATVQYDVSDCAANKTHSNGAPTSVDLIEKIPSISGGTQTIHQKVRQGGNYGGDDQEGRNSTAQVEKSPRQSRSDHDKGKYPNCTPEKVPSVRFQSHLDPIERLTTERGHAKNGGPKTGEVPAISNLALRIDSMPRSVLHDKIDLTTGYQGRRPQKQSDPPGESDGCDLSSANSGQLESLDSKLDTKANEPALQESGIHAPHLLGKDNECQPMLVNKPNSVVASSNDSINLVLGKSPSEETHRKHSTVGKPMASDYNPITVETVGFDDEFSFDSAQVFLAGMGHDEHEQILMQPVVKDCGVEQDCSEAERSGSTSNSVEALLRALLQQSISSTDASQTDLQSIEDMVELFGSLLDGLPGVTNRAHKTIESKTFSRFKNNTDEDDESPNSVVKEVSFKRGSKRSLEGNSKRVSGGYEVFIEEEGSKLCDADSLAPLDPSAKPEAKRSTPDPGADALASFEDMVDLLGSFLDIKGSKKKTFEDVVGSRTTLLPLKGAASSGALPPRYPVTDYDAGSVGTMRTNRSTGNRSMGTHRSAASMSTLRSLITAIDAVSITEFIEQNSILDSSHDSFDDDEDSGWKGFWGRKSDNEDTKDRQSGVVATTSHSPSQPPAGHGIQLATTLFKFRDIFHEAMNAVGINDVFSDASPPEDKSTGADGGDDQDQTSAVDSKDGDETK